MKTKEGAPTTSAPPIVSLESNGKDTHFSTTAKVLQIFLSGQKVTAHGINMEVRFNDARKAISLLRAKGYPILDRRLSDQRKVYYLANDWKRIMNEAKQANKQLNLFIND